LSGVTFKIVSEIFQEESISVVMISKAVLKI